MKVGLIGRKWTILVAALLLAAAGWFGLTHMVHKTPSPAVVEEGGGVPLDPLMIEAMRNRDYPGGQITVTEELGDFGGYTKKVISYPSDGLKQYALMAAPSSEPPTGGYPVVILCHGYIPPQDYRTKGTDYAAWIETMAQQGYVVIKPDYRGHDQSEGVARGGHFSPDYTVDVLNLVTSLKSMPEVNPDRLGIMGHSLGGHVALRAVVVSPNIKASVMVAGVVGTADDLVYGWRQWRVDKGLMSPPPAGVSSNRQQLLDKFGEPSTGNEYWHKIMAINYVDAVAGPMQIHHGTDDESVPPFMSEHLAQAMAKAGKAHEYYVYEGGDHNFTGAARGVFLERIMRFWGQNL